MKQLQMRSDELMGLINSANHALQIPTSAARMSFERSVQKAAPKIAAQLSKSFSKGKPEEIITMGTILGVAYVATLGYDTIQNGIAHKKARNALLGYYQELAAKQNLIIREQNRLSLEYARHAAQADAEAIQLKKRLQDLENLSGKILAFQNQINRS